MMRRTWIGVFVLAPIAACELVYPLDGYGPSDASTDGAQQGDAGCPATTPPQMARAGSFCVDTTEVNQSEYAAFLSAKQNDTSGQPSLCAFNTSFAPGVPPVDGGCNTTFFAPLSKGSYPVTCVDWCDAYAYCAWAGKRLCGRIDGGSNPFDQPIDPSSSQWFAACSRAGAQAFPYGSTYAPTACNGADFDASKPVPTGSLASCVGGYDGVFDMSGNVWEWEDSCGDASSGTTCRVRGGSYAEPSAKLSCDSSGQVNDEPPDWLVGNIGFRCCSK